MPVRRSLPSYSRALAQRYTGRMLGPGDDDPPIAPEKPAGGNAIRRRSPKPAAIATHAPASNHPPTGAAPLDHPGRAPEQDLGGAIDPVAVLDQVRGRLGVTLAPVAGDRAGLESPSTRPSVIYSREVPLAATKARTSSSIRRTSRPRDDIEGERIERPDPEPARQGPSQIEHASAQRTTLAAV